MIDGLPFVLVIGGADTGRSPLLAALLRRALPEAHVRTAGVLSHDGEPPDPEVAMALDQFGIRLGDHRARSLDQEELRQADLVLAVDRGIARVLQARYPHMTRVTALSDLAQSNDVIDVHRMPLGLWITAAKDFDAQIAAALPALRARLKVNPEAAPPSAAAEQPAPPPPAPTAEAVTAASGGREEPITRILRLIDTALVLPEIVDWNRLRTETSERLRSIAALAEGPADFTPAATTMIDGLLAQAATTPSTERLQRLRTMVERLAEPVDGAGLAAFGGDVAAWNTAQ